MKSQSACQRRARNSSAPPGPQHGCGNLPPSVRPAEQTMSSLTGPTIETRRHQVFPTLPPEEVERLRRFGEERSYRDGEYLYRTGEVAPGSFVVLKGEVVMRQQDERATGTPIVVYARGSFLGELSLLSGSPS